MAHPTVHFPRLSAAHPAAAGVRTQALAVLSVTLRHWLQASRAVPATQQG